MKRIILSIVVLFAFVVTASAQSTTRFPGGLTNQSKDTVGGDLPVPAQWGIEQIFEEFNNLPNGIPTKYIIAGSTTGGATPSASRWYSTNMAGLLIHPASADDNSIFMQSVEPLFTFETGKKMWFDSVAKWINTATGGDVSRATESDFVIGLQGTDTTPLAVDHGIYFRKDDGDQEIDVICKNEVRTYQVLGATDVYKNNSDIRFSFYYDGKDSLKFFINNRAFANIDPVTSSSTLKTPTTALRISFGMQNGKVYSVTDGLVRSLYGNEDYYNMLIKYVFAAKER